MTTEERTMVLINVRVPLSKKEELKELAHHCCSLGLIDKPELGRLFDLGMNLVFEVAHRRYLEIREQKEG